MKAAIAALLLFCSSMFAAGNAEKDVLAAIDAWKAAGLAFGLAGGLACSRALTSVLFYVAATDPTSYMSAVALAACLAPALRALSLDPVVVLREN